VRTDVLIVGGGPAGLAAAACLTRRNVEYVLLEQGERIATSWASFYDRLRLHTVRRLSGLPYRAMPARYPRYPARDQMVAYLREYATRDAIPAHTQQQVRRARPAADGWEVEASGGSYRARVLVMATGIYANPVRPHVAGMDQFAGRVLHSAEYRNAEPFAGQRILVVGAGNSGAEIAVDLASRAAHVAVSIRNGVNIVPLELLGVPIQRWAILVAGLPRPVTRVIAPPLLARSEARLRSAGIPKSPVSVLEATGKIPIIGLGLIDAVRAGHIAILPGIERFTTDGVRFVDGATHPFDAVVLATGFRPALDLLGDAVTLDARGFPARQGTRSTEHATLFFAGLNYDFAGTLNNIRMDSPALAEGVAAAVRHKVHVAAG
jgi:indole-3-pyruvate monooxygenase